MAKDMDHEALARRLETRLDKIEGKLDTFLPQQSSHEADIKWVKGYIRLSVTAMIALGVGLITTVLKLFF
jgi:hypothetical protein